MHGLNFKCPKCKNREYSVGEIRATGGLWTKIFNIQNRKFTSVTCSRCTYTEFYEGSTGNLQNVFDFFTN
ncbi:zinc ribbon domain-containing protein [candidate division KSB1 bacterium]